MITLQLTSVGIIIACALLLSTVSGTAQASHDSGYSTYQVTKDGYSYNVNISPHPDSYEFDTNSNKLIIRFNALSVDEIWIDVPKILFSTDTVDYVGKINGNEMGREDNMMGTYREHGVYKLFYIPAVIAGGSPYIVEFYPKPIPQATVTKGTSEPHVVADKPAEESASATQARQGDVTVTLISTIIILIGATVAFAIFMASRTARLRNEMRSTLPQRQSVPQNSSLSDRIHDFESRNKDEL